MLHLDAHHTNRSPYLGPSTPRLAWSFDAKGPIEAAPVVAPNGTILVATLEGTLWGLSPAGDRLFDVPLGGRSYCTPLATTERFFAGSDAAKWLGFSITGKPLFQLEVGGELDTSPTWASPFHLVFAAGRSVFVTDLAGTLSFRFRAAGKVFSSPAVGDDGTIYFGSQDDHLYAVSASGALLWSVDLGDDVDSAPAIGDDGRVFAGTDRGEVVALEPASGAIVWRVKVGGFVRGALSVGRKGTVFAGTYGPVPHLVALDPHDGHELFAFPIEGTGAVEFGIHGGPLEDAAGTLFFGAQDDQVYALRGDGSLLWKFHTGGDVDAPVVLTSESTLLVGSDDGRLYALQ